ncbi:MAG: putative ABC-type transporter, ATPase subunit [Chlamydiia bacterium]|nr:putative ABC-type transporter, ATPase subunit [Chlamydiia bacterium]
MTVALKVSNLTVHYDSSPVLWDINLEVPSGKLIGILGPNGAGKSTFMKALLGLVKPVSGAIFFYGKNLKNMRGKIAYIPQREVIDWSFPITVKELVLMGSYARLGFFKWIGKKELQAAEHCLELVGMQEFSSRQISELSGGQQQRVFLARSLLQEADIYFFDEPLSGVDHASEEIIMNILQNMKNAGKTIFMVHHDLNTVDAYFDWIILLNVRLIAAGEKMNIFTPQYMQEAYGKNFMVYDEAMKLSSYRTSGR